MRTILLKLRKTVIRARCERSAVIGRMFDVEPGAAITNEGPRTAITIEDYVFLGGQIAMSRHGRIRVGAYSWIGSGVVIASASEVTIGRYVGIAAGVHIIDNNNHPTDPAARIKHRIRVAPGGEGYPTPFAAWELSDTKPIIIEDNVWVGMGSFIGKGARIGEGAIVARQSVVTRDVPPYSVVAGNPARVVKRLDVPSVLARPGERDEDLFRSSDAACVDQRHRTSK